MSKSTNLVFFGFIILIFFAIFGGCGEKSNRNTYYNTNITVSQDASQDLDLKAVGEMMKTVTNGEELERKLNGTNPQINNLDLDENGKVDYITVSEYGSGNVKGFSLTTQLENGEEQEIATIEIEKDGEYANSEIRGNQHIYGNNHYYHSRFGVTDFLLMSWLFSNRPLWHSPHHYGNYPTDYRTYGPISSRQYRDQTASYRNTGSFTRSNTSTLSNQVSSPNSGKNATGIKAPLKNPTQAQKSFQARNPSKKLGSGGFGQPTVRKSSSSRTRSYSGGGK